MINAIHVLVLEGLFLKNTILGRILNKMSSSLHSMQNRVAPKVCPFDADLNVPSAFFSLAGLQKDQRNVHSAKEIF
jgi:hypothetical protein